MIPTRHRGRRHARATSARRPDHHLWPPTAPARAARCLAGSPRTCGADLRLWLTLRRLRRLGLDLGHRARVLPGQRRRLALVWVLGRGFAGLLISSFATLLVGGFAALVIISFAAVRPLLGRDGLATL